MNIKPLLTELGTGFMDLLYPRKCLVCLEIGSATLCERCRSDIVYRLSGFCLRCGRNTLGDYCPDCAAGRRYDFEQARCLGEFAGVLQHAIHQYKYEGRKALGEPLGEMLADYLSQAPFLSVEIDCVAPVPLHPVRQRSRGFNQSQLLAEVVSRKIDRPLVSDALRRTRNTRPQATLRSASDRRDNIREAFTCPTSPEVESRAVLLVDDVLTSANTLNECARALVSAGAKCVLVLTLAHG